VERECNIKLKKGDEPQYGRWLRWLPPRKEVSEGRRSWNDNRGEEASVGEGSLQVMIALGERKLWGHFLMERVQMVLKIGIRVS
jgi:hypothetical protein